MKYVKPEGATEQSLILDVRTPDEIREEALSLPFFNEELSKLNPRDFVYEHNLDGSKTLNIICHSGSRSQRAAELFEKNGFFNVAGGGGGGFGRSRTGRAAHCPPLNLKRQSPHK